MDELIQILTTKLGIDPKTASAAVAKIMAMVRQHGGAEIFDKIAAAVPGAADSAANGESKPAGGGGMLGKLAGMASSAIGGKAGGGLELTAALAAAGISTEQIGPLVTTVIEFLRNKLGDETVDQLLGKFPMLKTLLP